MEKKIYMAPLEGVTTYVYRNAFQRYFGGVDRYYTPFIVSQPNKVFSAREWKELDPVHNQGLDVVPQIMSNNGDDTLCLIRQMAELGYREINLNLGCPSKTVVTKKRGAGFLAFPEELDRYLDQVYAKTPVNVSIKTRIGKEDPEEFHRLLEIYNQYPVTELIVHPRVQTDYYKNKPNWEMYQVAYEECKHPLCYNGDIVDAASFEAWKKRFDKTPAIMIGRGLIQNPGLAGDLKEGTRCQMDILYHFHQEILEAYLAISSGERNALFKMKELWCYMGGLFEGAEKHIKKMRKAEHVDKYQQAVDLLFATCSLKEP